MHRSILRVLVPLVLLVCTAGFVSDAGKNPRKPASRTIVLYYFHRTIRCAECRAIETAAQRALESAFARELKSGRVAWRPTNLDEGDNQKLEDHYGLEHQSLVLSEVVNGKEKRWKLLEKTWDIYHNPADLMKYVIAETKAFLKR